MVARRAALAVLVVLAALVAPRLHRADAADARAVEVVTWINVERAWNGRRSVVLDPSLTAQAELQNGRLVACGCLYHSPHPELVWWLQRGWRSIGENVGYGTATGWPWDAWGVHLALVRSPGHLANLIGDYDAVGVAVTEAGGRVYVTQVFGSV